MGRTDTDRQVVYVYCHMIDLQLPQQKEMPDSLGFA